MKRLLILFITTVNGLVLPYFRPSFNKNIIMNIDLIELSKNNQLYGETWSSNDVENNVIDFVGIFKNADFALFYSNGELHKLNYVDSMLKNLIEYFNSNNIDYQVYDNTIFSSDNILSSFMNIGLFYVLGSIVLNIVNRMNLSPMKRLDNTKIIEENSILTTFNDVAGIAEAKEELLEIVDFFKNPIKYEIAGARIPKGILLEGPPGTGKTLLARAVAGEAGVSFISASGSSFIEMFVGVGSSRIRNLFEKAQEISPCVIFIDEIDAIGGKRGYGVNSGGNDEREQTLNQLLTCMDGFDQLEGVIILAATNRADILDPALKRSGRFDRKIIVNLPNFQERIEIAKFHFKNKLNNTISYNNLASLTNGFSGADIENLANEAVLISIKENKTFISNEIVNKAFEKITIGLPKKNLTVDTEIKILTSVHEAGHAMIVKYFDKFFVLKRISINSNTNGAGGYTLFTPHEYYQSYPTKEYYIAQLMVALGGRAAEIVYFNSTDNELITAGASGDIQKANLIAKNYIELFENYITEPCDITKRDIDKRINELINDCLNKSIDIIQDNHISLNSLVYLLMNEITVEY